METNIKQLMLVGSVIALTLLNFPLYVYAQRNNINDATSYAPTQSGISLNSGYTYDPSDNTFFIQTSVFKLYDYDRIWKHKAPDNLRFKVEGSLGSALFEDDTRCIANAGILALLYLDKFKTDHIKPYLEAGIGIIYTDYRVQGQDYRLNFNPQAGFGVEFNRKGKQNRFVSFRLHHISNGGLGSINRGQNSIVFTFGQYF